MTASFDLERFVNAQAPVYERVLSELHAGLKQSHWMWFIFPQIAGLGHSAMSQRYAIVSLQEAIEYLHHPLLGPRLRECTKLVTAVSGRSIESILGWPDNMKFHSSMTLFAQASDDDREFVEAIQKYFSGRFDQATLERLNSPHDASTE
ncbi:uncharacterized protein (DUF1810 family) [Nitrobacteraceae bacterium AZCC 1564]